MKESASKEKSIRIEPLPSEKPGRRIQDIIDNAGAIERYLANVAFAEFERDQKTRDAVERCLERISEAASKLGDLAEQLMPEQPWRNIRAFGNRLRHEDNGILVDRLWKIVTTDLPPLRRACEETLKMKYSS